jgi:hypothetical protein
MTKVTIPVGQNAIEGDLILPEGAKGAVIFAAAVAAVTALEINMSLRF